MRIVFKIVLLVIVICASGIPAFAEDLPAAEGQAEPKISVRDVLDSLKRDIQLKSNQNYAINIINDYNKLYPKSIFNDDFIMIKAIIFNIRQDYIGSNAEFDLLLNKYPSPVIEKEVIDNITLLPGNLLKKFDVITYINIIRAENYMLMGDNERAMVSYEGIVNRMTKDKLLMGVDKEMTFKVYSNLSDIYIKVNKIPKTKLLIKDFLRNDNVAVGPIKDKMREKLSQLYIKFATNRNPFVYGEIKSAVVSVDKRIILTGIIIQGKGYSIWINQGKSFIKRRGEELQGYRIINIDSEKVILMKDNKQIHITLGEGFKI